MPRKPAPLELAGGKGKRQRIWEAIRRLGAGGAVFTADDISRQTHDRRLGGIDLEAIHEYRRALVSGGVLAVVSEHSPRTPASFRLARDCGMDAPRLRRDGSKVLRGLAQEQMWRTLRLLEGDTNARELAAHASTPDIPVAESAAQGYLHKLQLAGYLQCTRAGRIDGKGVQRERFRLKPGRNTGPRPPMVCSTKVIWDPNENKIAWQPPVSEEDAVYGK